MKSLFALLAGLAVAGPALAQSPASRDPAKVEAGTYAVEPNHTRIQFAVDHMGFTNFWGDFTGASGSLELKNPGAGGSTLSVSVPVASVSTTNTKLDGELKSADWLDADKFPTMTFKTTAVTPGTAGTAKVAGDLTLHGVTKPVTFMVKLHGSGPNIMTKKATVGFDVSGKIKRSDFGVSKYLPLIGDEIDITIAAAFEKQG